MGIIDFFIGKKKRTPKQTARPLSKLEDNALRTTQLLLQSPYVEDRQKALARLNPAGGATVKQVPPSHRSYPGRERMVLVLDRSGSMGTQDYLPSRLEAAKEAAAEMIHIKMEHDPMDEVGIVWFHENGCILQKLVSLASGKERLLRKLETLYPEDGTDINAGLRAAAGILGSGRADVQDRVLLLTDGFGGHPLQTAKALKNRGVVIDVIGIGGNPSEVNGNLLRKVASTINGDNRYRFIANREELFKHFRALADKLVK